MNPGDLVRVHGTNGVLAYNVGAVTTTHLPANEHVVFVEEGGNGFAGGTFARVKVYWNEDLWYVYKSDIVEI